MEHMESKTIANIIGRDSSVTEFRVVCHGSHTYRVWMGSSPVLKLFSTFESAAAYAANAAKHEPSVMVGLAKLQMM